MDASTGATSAADFAPETLSRSFSTTRLDHGLHHHRHRCPSPSFLTASPSDPCLYKSASASATISWSRLNVRAPEYKPRSSVPSASASPPSSPMLSPSISSSSLSSLSGSTGNLLALAQQSQQTDLAASFVIPRPPGPPALVHVFNSAAAAAASSPSGSIFQIHSSSLDSHFGLAYRGSPQLPLYGFLDQPQLDVSFLANSDAAAAAAADPSNGGLPEETALKIINQVEFYFSDVNLATTAFIYKIMVKDPEGFVPISVVASIKKIKTLTRSQSQLATVLRNSSKLVVSDDGKKVRRLHPLSELEMEEVQSRIIIAENLPEDHCHQNLLRIFSAVGSVKSIRTCQPSVSSTSTSKTAKTDALNFSNKLHAFVEYESVELAEKAVLELNEGNWRNGLTVRLLLKRSPKSAQACGRKVGSESEHNFKEEGFALEQMHLHEKYLEDSVQHPSEHVGEEHANFKEGGGLKKSRSREFREVSENRGWGKGRGRPTYNNSNHRGGNHAGGVTSGVSINVEQAAGTKQPSVPRMPDGTRGFSMGRGKPVAVKTA